MATVDKNFRIKNGLVIEGSTATLNGNNILSENTQAGDSYILNLVGGATLVKSVDTGVFNVDGSGNLTVNSNVFDSYGSASDAQSAAENYANSLASNYDPAGSAQGAYNNAVSYVDGEIVDALNTAQGYATTATTNANSYTDGRESAITAAYESYADTAEQDAKNYADSLASNYDPAGSATTAENNAKGYADSLINDASTTSTNVWSAYKTSSEIGVAVSNLVDSAPALLDTLNELAAAIADNPNYATDMAANLAAKQNTLTAGSNIDITSDVISVTGLDTADVSEDASALYFTDTRAKDAVSSALGDGIEYVNGSFDVQLGTGLELDGNNSIQVNRTETDAWYDAAGSATLAQSAAEQTALGYVADVLDATTPFTDLNINDVAKQVAARTTSLGSVAVTAYQFNKINFKSGKFLVKIDNGTHNEISEILVTLDSSDNVAITEYAIVGTNGTRGTITADVVNSHCRIRVTPVNDSTITVAGTVFNA
jgi:hypothetical protein